MTIEENAFETKFQFLMVRLKVGCVGNFIKDDKGISIPYGAIKRFFAFVQLR